MIHFLRPSWLLLLLPALIYLMWIIRSTQNRNPWHKVCDAHLLPVLIEKNHSSSSKLYNHCLLFLFYIFSIFALAGPAFQKVSLPIFQETEAWTIVFDLSNNMNVTDIQPTRLQRAKYKIYDITSTAKNLQIGLVAFTEEAFVASPLSKDASTLNNLVTELHPGMMPVSGADSSKGILLGQQLLKQAGFITGNILLITASAPTNESFSAAKKIAENGAHLYILAMVANEKENQHTIQQLRQLANLGGGNMQLFTAGSTDVQAILQHTSSGRAVQQDKKDQAFLWKDAGPLICLLLLPIAFFMLREYLAHEKG